MKGFCWGGGKCSEKRDRCCHFWGCPQVALKGGRFNGKRWVDFLKVIRNGEEGGRYTGKRGKWAYRKWFN